MTTEEAGIRERAELAWHTRTSGTDSSQAFRDRVTLLRIIDAERARVERVRALLDSPLRFVQLGEISAALDGTEQQGA